MAEHSKPAILVISSHVARGSVGNRAAVFALETLGFPVWAIPTIQLPWHPGHGPATRIVPDDEEFKAFLKDVENAPWIDEVGAVLTGYMANAAQAKAVAQLISALKQKNPELTHLCDPVIGDVGGLYVKQEVAEAIRDNLLPLSDIATPNRYELAWLIGKDGNNSLDAVIGQSRMLNCETALVTSCPCDDDRRTGNLLLGKRDATLASHPVINKPPNGPGDLTAAIFLGHHLSGMDTGENLHETTASVFEILQNSIDRGSNELTLAADSKSISNPQVEITVKFVGQVAN